MKNGIEALWQDVRYDCRTIRRNLAFTVIVVLTLALGIGANTAVFSVLNSILLKPLSYPRAEELVALRQIATGAEGLASSPDGLRLSPSMYLTYAENNRVFESLGVWVITSSTVTGVAEPEQVRIVGVSDGLLEAFKVPPAAGRWFQAADVGGAGASPSAIKLWNAVMLSYGYWQRRFGGDPSVIGRTITVDSLPREVVGVMPRGFRIVNAEADVFFPMAFDRGPYCRRVARERERREVRDARCERELRANTAPVHGVEWRYRTLSDRRCGVATGQGNSSCPGRASGEQGSSGDHDPS